MQASNLQQEANLISRMERMPLNKALLTLVGLLSWCWVMEAFDLGMIGQVVAVLTKIWDLDGGGRHRYGFGGLPDRPFRAQAHPALGRLHLHVLYIDRQPLRKPRVDRHHALHRRARGRGRLPSPLPDAFRNRPGQAPRHPRLHLQRHPDGLLSASDALRLVGHQQFFAGRRVARAVHRGRAPHRHDLFPAPLAPRIPALADAARTP